MYEKEKKELENIINNKNNRIANIKQSISFKQVLMVGGVIVSIGIGLAISPLFEYMFLGPMFGLAAASGVVTYLQTKIEKDKQRIADANLAIQNAEKDINAYKNDERKQLNEHLKKIQLETQKNAYTYKKDSGIKSNVELENNLMKVAAALYDESQSNDNQNLANGSNKGRK